MIQDLVFMSLLGLSDGWTENGEPARNGFIMITELVFMSLVGLSGSLIVINTPTYYDCTAIPISSEDLNNQQWITIQVRTASDAQLRLMSDYNPYGYIYEVVICGWHNTQLAIRKGASAVNMPAILCDANEFRPFWVSWEGGVISVGRGLDVGNDQITNWTDISPQNVNYLGVLTSGGYIGEWVIEYERGCSEGFVLVGEDAVQTATMLTLTVTSDTRSACSSSCYRHTWCKGFSFRQVQQECQMLDRTPQVQDLATQAGWETWAIISET